MIYKNDRIAQVFNGYFSTVVQKLNLHEWSLCKPLVNSNTLSTFVNNCRHDPSITKIKREFFEIHTFSLKPLNVANMANAIKDTPNNFSGGISP